jgi:hypothetical protein
MWGDLRGGKKSVSELRSSPDELTVTLQVRALLLRTSLPAATREGARERERARDRDRDPNHHHHHPAKRLPAWVLAKGGGAGRSPRSSALRGADRGAGGGVGLGRTRTWR